MIPAMSQIDAAELQWREIRIPLSSIEVLPDRQRADYGDIAGLAASIKRLGQLQPIVVSPFGERFVLLAGGRRFRAISSLGHESIRATLLEDLPKSEQELIELEENVRRKDLEWPEYVTAVARFVALSDRSQREVAADLQIHESSISKIVQLSAALSAKPSLRNASSWKSAYDLYAIDVAKQQAATMEEALSIIDDIDISENGIEQLTPTFLEEKSSPPSLPSFTHLQSFLDWAPSYSGKRFNLIHCDFPYGLNMDTANLQGSSDRWQDSFDGRYDDSPELFEALTRTFFEHQDRFIAESAHCIFWLAHKNFGKIWSRFRYFGWTPCEVPLIWHKSDNVGIAPDVHRQPRRTYEIAIFATRGDRKIAKVKAASCSFPTTKEHHLSEKPLAVVTHFLEMLTDEHTELLDPTCGSGTALEAVLRLGANRVLGLDVLERHVERSERRCQEVKHAGGSSLDGLSLDLL